MSSPSSSQPAHATSISTAPHRLLSFPATNKSSGLQNLCMQQPNIVKPILSTKVCVSQATSSSDSRRLGKMAEQPRTRHLGGALSTRFRSSVKGLTHEWGFVVVRTAYAADKDEAQWAAVLEKLRAYATPDNDEAEMDPDTFALPVMADSAVLCGADYVSVRKAFNGWVDDFTCRERPSDDDDDNDDNDDDQDDDQDEEWPSDVRRDACIVIDEPALASLLGAPDFVPGKVPDLKVEPWVVVVDAKDPASVAYSGGGPYMGFTRSYVRVLGQLFEDLGSQTLARLSPIREYDGQIPLYDGSTRGKLVDPAGGAEGRFKFPRGTPRGADGARAMLEDIERAVGRADCSGH
ncbi:hypothetical protein CTA2_2501 [Colletotrichum tanaceti]|nr:hypothetical protein CTA2_2501 [Colletotrichum tanaceti]